MRLLLMLGNGFEEIEALGTLDLLRRAEIDVDTCTVNTTPTVLGAHNIVTQAQLCVGELDSTAYDGVILPGGMGGTSALAATEGVLDLLREFDAAGKLICAICAAPAVVLTAAGILRDRKVTGYPAEPLIAALGDNYEAAEVRASDNLITAAGPGSFAAFAKAIITAAKDADTATAVMRDALID